MKQEGWRLGVKRAMDLVGASAALCALSPVMLATAAAVRVRLGRPVLFRQRRPGRGGRIFTAYKFRTMREAFGPDGEPLPDAERLTPFGRAVRRTSLDELPQLWNVVRGELSLVGPRPLLVRYLERYSPEQARRLEVLPGVTGWAQVNGRNATSWDERFAHDIWYVDNWSLGLDVRTLGLTVWWVLKGAGVSQAGHATMPEFMGAGVSQAESATTPALMGAAAR